MTSFGIMHHVVSFEGNNLIGHRGWPVGEIYPSRTSGFRILTYNRSAFLPVKCIIMLALASAPAGTTARMTYC